MRELSFKKTNLILKNAFFSIKSTKFHFFSLVFLFLILGLVGSFFSIISERLVGEINYIDQTSRIHDFLVDFKDIVKLKKKNQVKKLSDLEIFQDLMSDTGAQYHFDFTRRETRSFFLENFILKLVGVSQYDQSVDQLVVFRGHGLTTHNKKEQIVDNDRGIVLESEFAQLHGVSIGDVVRIIPDNYGSHFLVAPKNYHSWNRKQSFKQWIDQSRFKNYSWFEVVGYGTSADLIYPMISRDRPIVNKKNQGIGYVTNQNFGLKWTTPPKNNPKHQLWTFHNDVVSNRLFTTSTQDIETYYVGSFTQPVDQKKILHDLNQQIFNTSYRGYIFHHKVNMQARVFFARGDPSYFFHQRVDYPSFLIKMYLSICVLFLLFMSLLSIFSTYLFIRARMRLERGQIGILKASGYNKREIMTGFIVVPLFAGLLGGVSGYLLSLVGETIIFRLFSSMFNLNFHYLFFPWISLIFGIFSLFLVLLILGFGIGTRFLQQNSLVLLNDVKTKAKIFVTFSRIKIKIFSSKFFWLNLHNKIFLRSKLKFLSVFMTTFATAIIFSSTCFFIRGASDLQKYFFYGKNYQIISYYNTPKWNAPTSFYRTYNWKNQQRIHATNKGIVQKDVAQLIGNIMQHDIPKSYYQFHDLFARKFSVPDYLYNLTWKNFSNTAWKKLIAGQKPVNKILWKILLSQSWAEGYQIYQQLEEAHLLSGQFWKNSPIKNDPHAIKKLFQLLQRFYFNYSSTQMLSFNRFAVKDYLADDLFAGPLINSKKDLKAISYIPDQSIFFFNNDNIDPFVIQHNQLMTVVSGLSVSEDQFLKQPLPTNIDTQVLVHVLQHVINWFHLYFTNRVYPTVYFGIYSQSPYFIRQLLNDPQADYNTSFNLVPQQPDDYLGTFLNTSYHNHAFRLLGITPAASKRFFPLINNDYLFQNNKASDEQTIYPIVINETLARVLKVHTGDYLTTKVTVPEIGNPIGNHSLPIATDDDYWPNWQQVTKVGKGDWINFFDFKHLLHSDIAQDVTGFLLNSLQLSEVVVRHREQHWQPFQNNLFSAYFSQILKKILKNKIVEHYPQKNIKLQVRDIQQNYGLPVAYFNEAVAEKILHYDFTQAVLWKMFRKIWSTDNHIDPADYPQYQAIIRQIQTTNNLPNEPNPAQKQMLKMFHNAFPIFNYRVSHNPQPDFKIGFSVHQPYGDFTHAALNGGVNGEMVAPKNAFSSLHDMEMQTLLAQGLKKQLSAFLIVSLFISMCFILISIIITGLTNNLMMVQHQRMIRIMGVFGYYDREMIGAIFASWFVLTPLLFLAGVATSWYFFLWLTNLLINNYQFAFPQIFHLGYFCLIVGMLLVLTIICFGIGYVFLKNKKIQKIINNNNSK